METLALINLAIAALKVGIPALQAEIKSGQRTPEEQAKVQASLDELRGLAAFEGPEWAPSKK